MVVEVNNRLTK